MATKVTWTLLCDSLYVFLVYRRRETESCCTDTPDAVAQECTEHQEQRVVLRLAWAGSHRARGWREFPKTREMFTLRLGESRSGLERQHGQRLFLSDRACHSWKMGGSLEWVRQSSTKCYGRISLNGHRSIENVFRKRLGPFKKVYSMMIDHFVSG